MAIVATCPDDWDKNEAQALGYFIIAFAQLEAVLRLGPGRLSDLTFEEKIRLGRELGSNPARAGEIMARYEIRVMDQHAEGELAKVLVEVGELNDERNKRVHAAWIQLPDGARAVIPSSAGARVAVDVGALQSLTTTAIKLRERINAFTLSNGEQRPSDVSILADHSTVFRTSS